MFLVTSRVLVSVPLDSSMEDHFFVDGRLQSNSL